MRIHRIFTDQELQPGHTVHLPEATAHYLSRVLRVTVGQRVLVFNGDGHDYAADIERLGRGELGLQLQTRLPAAAESPRAITLVQAISRGERMDISIQKATELGVTSIQPVFSARCEVKLKAEKLQRRVEHWRRVAISACEQSGRARLPELKEPVDLWAWLEQQTPAVRLALLPGAEHSLARVAEGVDGSSGFDLLIGPEGGFDEQEVALLERAGVRAVHLGPRVLRTETAGPAAIAVIQAVAGDLA